MGFSIKDEQKYSPARPDSDIDITIVSESLFQEYWEAVFRFANDSYEFRESREYVVFAKTRRGDGSCLADCHKCVLSPRRKSG